MRARLSVIVLGTYLAFGMSALMMSPTAYAQQKVNPKVGAALQAAQEAAKGKKFDVAIAKVKEAEAEKKSAFEQFKINETLAFIYGAQGRYGDLASVYEKMMESPQFLGDASRINAKTVAQTYAAAQQNAKVIEFAKKWLQDKPNDVEVQALLGQTYYTTKDYKACKETVSNAISSIEKSGGRPAENLLQFSRSCSDSLADANAAAQSLEKLVRYYPKANYWQLYIKQNERNASDLAAFYWSRLKYEVGTLGDADDYSNYAQQAMLQYGSPSEGLRVVEEGFKKGVLGSDPKNKVRHDKLMTNAKSEAQSNKARWAQMATEADADATGEKSVLLGMAYYGAEQYDQAIAQLEKGLKKGGLKDAGHARLTLGIAQLKKGHRDAARASFKAAAADAGLTKVANAWTLRSFN